MYLRYNYLKIAENAESAQNISNVLGAIASQLLIINNSIRNQNLEIDNIDKIIKDINENTIDWKEIANTIASCAEIYRNLDQMIKFNHENLIVKQHLCDFMEVTTFDSDDLATEQWIERVITEMGHDKL